MPTVPTNFEPWVQRLRRFIKDEADINDLLEAQENTDYYLYECIGDALDEINWTYEPITEYTITDVRSGGGSTVGVPWIIVRSGAVLQLLTGTGIHSSRNAFTYSDGSGIQVSDSDAWGRYINYYNVLINKYKEMVSHFKLKRNIDDAYGGHHSQYNDIWS
jgi:hypothetical protein